MGKQNEKYELDIIKWLYLLSFKYPHIKDTYYLNGLGTFSNHIYVYSNGLSKEINDIFKDYQKMTSDKEKRLYYKVVSDLPIGYMKSVGDYKTLEIVFDIYREELRELQIRNLLK